MASADPFALAPIFEGIASESIQELRLRGQVVSYESGHLLFERGQNAEQLMVLHSGVVELFFPVRIMGVTRELTLERAQAGGVLAWSTLVDPHHFTLSARCASECVITGFSREALHGYFERDPKAGYLFMRNLAGVIGQRLQALQTIWVHDLQSSVIRGLE